VIKMGVIIDVVYCNIYQCFLVAQGDPKKKGATTCKKYYFGKKIETYISIGSAICQHMRIPFRAWVHDKCEIQHASPSSGIRKLVKNQQKWQTVYITSSRTLNPWWPCHILAQLYPKLFKRPDWSNLQKVTAAKRALGIVSSPNPLTLE
jgi:hypothetical protein